VKGKSSKIREIEIGAPVRYPKTPMIEVKTISPDRWSEARELRLQALKTELIAFGSSYEEEEKLSEVEWQRRIKNNLFAVSDDGKLVGSITYLFNDRLKTKHVARIFGVYVDPSYRGRGVGRKLLDRALELIQENKDIVKVQLMVNPKQLAALQLYKKIGFEVVGEMKKEIKVGEEFYDECIMEKML
jgi:ribosomal protein S18 acetylase RimI-like enzyme